MSSKSLSLRTRINWLIDASIFVGGLIASLTGIYFLFLPSGGFRGGRNPFYGVTILFDRHTWDDVHTWLGIVMIVAAVVHLAIHWTWVKMMTKRMIDVVRSRGVKMSQGAKINIAIDATVAISFVIAAISGLYFFFFPEGSRVTILFNSTMWDLLHTWSGVTMIVAVLMHLAIHWRWITNVTSRFFSDLWRPTQVELAHINARQSEA
jgi:protein-S-isoprenylcysteine O-methyltransferase Ste14